jgi:TRAP-type C4-dicarboxylate transport system substrate-binding protein
VLAPEVLVASVRTWEKLDDKQKEHLQAAVGGSVPIMRALWDARVEESRRRVLEDGIELVEDIDHDAFSKRMRPVWEAFLTTPRLRELAQQIVDIEVPDA